MLNAAVSSMREIMSRIYTLNLSDFVALRREGDPEVYGPCIP